MEEQFSNPNYYGYIRVSTLDQKKNSSLEEQRSQLLNYGVPSENIICEIGSGLKNVEDRVLLKEFLNQYDHLTELELLKVKICNEQIGKRFICVYLDRVSRDLKSGMALLNKFDKCGIKFIPLNLPYSKEESFSQIIYALLLWLAEYETIQRKQRQNHGIKHAIFLGKYKNRKRSKLSNEVIEQIKNKLLRNLTPVEIYRSLKISKSSFYTAKQIIDGKKR
jgi:DNA invertase Pin-like site-specific DNA recombinase